MQRERGDQPEEKLADRTHRDPDHRIAEGGPDDRVRGHGPVVLQPDPGRAQRGPVQPVLTEAEQDAVDHRVDHHRADQHQAGRDEQVGPVAAFGDRHQRIDEREPALWVSPRRLALAGRGFGAHVKGPARGDRWSAVSGMWGWTTCDV